MFLLIILQFTQIYNLIKLRQLNFKLNQDDPEMTADDEIEMEEEIPSDRIIIRPPEGSEGRSIVESSVD